MIKPESISCLMAAARSLLPTARPLSTVGAPRASQVTGLGLSAAPHAWSAVDRSSAPEASSYWPAQGKKEKMGKKNQLILNSLTKPPHSTGLKLAE